MVGGLPSDYISVNVIWDLLFRATDYKFAQENRWSQGTESDKVWFNYADIYQYDHSKGGSSFLTQQSINELVYGYRFDTQKEFIVDEKNYTPCSFLGISFNLWVHKLSCSTFQS